MLAARRSLSFEIEEKADGDTDTEPRLEKERKSEQ